MNNSGIPEIDRQHNELFKILYRLKDSMNTRDENQESKIFLDELRNYVKFHFSYEERLMEKCNYSDLKNHKDVHSDFSNLINEASISFAVSNQLSKKTIQFVEDWLIYHIEVEEELFHTFLVPCLFSSSGKTPVS